MILTSEWMRMGLLPLFPNILGKDPIQRCKSQSLIPFMPSARYHLSSSSTTTSMIITKLIQASNTLIYQEQQMSGESYPCNTHKIPTPCPYLLLPDPSRGTVPPSSTRLNPYRQLT